MSLRVATALLVTLALAFSQLVEPKRADAAPDPTIASLLSLGSTLVPVGVSGVLLFRGRGSREGLRFDLGLVSLGVGSIGGPSVGQIYGGGGVDAVVTFVLRTLTGAVLLVGTGLALRGEGGTDATGTALAILGGIPTGLLAAWDIFGAASSARAARLREGHGPATTLDGSQDLASMLRCPGPIPCL